MIYWKDDSLLLATGLSLRSISKILLESNSEEEVIQNLSSIDGKYSKRYLLMKEYFSLMRQGLQKLPLIIVLAGMPGMGKTAFAHELSISLNIKIVIGGDSLRSSFRQLLTKESHKEFFTSVYDTWKKFGDYNKSNLIDGYIEQSSIMNKAIEFMIADRGLRDGESLIIEYLHFLPSQFNKDILAHPSLIPIVLRVDDETILTQRILERSHFSHLRSDGERLIAQKDKYQILQEYQCKEAANYGIKIINLDDFDLGFDLALDYIFERIKKLNALKDFDQKLAIVEKIEKQRKGLK